MTPAEIRALAACFQEHADAESAIAGASAALRDDPNTHAPGAPSAWIEATRGAGNLRSNAAYLAAQLAEQCEVLAKHVEALDALAAPTALRGTP
jgi:hypothetical protein